MRNINPCTAPLLLPLFRHTANSAAMMRHCISIVQCVMKKLSPSQTPVIATDQPLYAFTKQIQWHWPTTFGRQVLHCSWWAAH